MLDKFVDAHGMHQDRVTAREQGVDPRFQIGALRHEHDRDVDAPTPPAQAELDAADGLERSVEHDKIGRRS